MFILTNADNVIMHISETIGYQKNGNVLIKKRYSCNSKEYRFWNI